MDVAVLAAFLSYLTPSTYHRQDINNEKHGSKNLPRLHRYIHRGRPRLDPYPRFEDLTTDERMAYIKRCWLLHSTIDDRSDHEEEEAEMSASLAVRQDSNRGLISGQRELSGIAIDLVRVLRLEPEPWAVSTI
jgi:hypothetical protein